MAITTKKLVTENYYKFCNLEGNNYIASEFALHQILRLIKKFHLESVLEIGLGIGSISDTVLKMVKKSGGDFNYVGTEANEYCKNALKENVENYAEIELYENLSKIGSEKKFDLIVIDGQDNVLNNIAARCTKRAIIFIEGDRKPQKFIIMSLFPKAKHVQVISLKKNKIYSPGDPSYFVGGGQLIFIDPNFKMNAFYIREKLATSIKRRLRKII